MKAIIVGGGKVGYFLAKTLLNTQTNAIIIEKDAARAQQLSDELNIDVLCGDGSDISILDEAETHDAQIIAAVTGNDEENLVICQIAKVRYPHQKTIARVNNPKNIEMFKALGVDKTVCSTKVIADLIDYEMDSDSIKVIQTFERGNMVLAELILHPECEWANHPIKDIEVPKDLLFISILRQDETLFPKGDTLLLPMDHVMFVASSETIAALRKRVGV